MGDINNIKFEPHFKLPKILFGKAGANGQGGQGGSIFVITEELTGEGEITADGGDGSIGGRGGQIHIQAKNNYFKGKISAKGGKGEGEN